MKKFKALYKMGNGTFLKVYEKKDGTLVDDNNIAIAPAELMEYKKIPTLEDEQNLEKELQQLSCKVIDIRQTYADILTDKQNEDLHLAVAYLLRAIDKKEKEE